MNLPRFTRSLSFLLILRFLDSCHAFGCSFFFLQNHYYSSRSFNLDQRNSGAHSRETVSTSVDASGPSPLVSNLGIDSLDKTRIQGVRKTVIEKQDIEFSISRVSCSPNIFLLKNFLSPSECEALIKYVKELNNNEKETASVTEGDAGVIRSNCTVAWVQNEDTKLSDAPSIPREIGRVAGNLLLTDDAKAKGWCEPLQVVHYSGQGGKFDLHHDGLGRSLTIIYYLNGVGNTWFPFAKSLGELPIRDKPRYQVDTTELKSRCDAVRLVEKLPLVPGHDGILAAGVNSQILKDLKESNIDAYHSRHHNNIVTVAAGDAIAFFNYKTQVNGESGKSMLVRDMRSIHAGLPTSPKEGEKWIANHWMHSDPFYLG